MAEAETETGSQINQQATQLAAQKAQLEAQQAQFQQEQAKQAELALQYQPKVRTEGYVNPAYQRPLELQTQKTQQQYQQLSSGVEAYNKQVEQYKSYVEKAQQELATLPQTPQSEADIAQAEQLYEKGFISGSDLASYKETAQKNIASAKFAEEAKAEIAKLSLTPTKQEDIAFAEGLLGRGFIEEADFLGYKGIAESNIKSRMEMYPARIGIHTSTYRDRFGATHIRYWSDKAPNGNFAEGSFQITSSKGRVEYTPEQAMEKIYSDSTSYLGINRWDFVGQESRAPPGAIPGESLYTLSQREAISQQNLAALHQRRADLMAGFTGTFADPVYSEQTGQMENLASMPIGSIVDPVAYAKSLGATPQDLLKMQMLQSPTAQWASEKDFGQKLAEVSDKFYVTKPAGTILGSTPEQRQAEKMLYEQTDLHYNLKVLRVMCFKQN